MQHLTSRVQNSPDCKHAQKSTFTTPALCRFVIKDSNSGTNQNCGLTVTVNGSNRFFPKFSLRINCGSEIKI